jgi:hypothetical protein
VALRLLFRPPPSEPYVQVSPHTALQWPESQEVGWMCRHHGRIRLSPNHIPGMSPPWLPTAPVRLPPFAMGPALPAADYYGGSVALGLAPDRRSRLPTRSTTARVRCPVRPLEPPHWRPLSRAEAFRGRSGKPRIPGVLGSGVVRGVGFCTAGDWGSSNSAFTLSCGSRGATPYTSSDVPASTACSCPLGLSPSGEPLTRGCYFRTSPALGRNRPSDETAHPNEPRAPGVERPGFGKGRGTGGLDGFPNSPGLGRFSDRGLRKVGRPPTVSAGEPGGRAVEHSP